MGKKGVNTIHVQAEARKSAGELFERANLYLDAHADSPIDNFFRAETPSGATIKKIYHSFMIEADFTSPEQGVCSIDIEYDVDKKDLPRVEEIPEDGSARTVPIRNFPLILGDVLALIP